ncbi:DNA cytosine methyltransferase [Streptomyces viridochromogenes]|uniref:DNA cytosine methyltransferase n=1 Tax=Streptomyces viridochromogenes TaxID=1938 RepID=UPI00069D0B6E|nr:DNA cytosine methyltransferase [Streptomyces viridochromogenes]KOG26806.1 DNA methyltransferase [Streptomyces viridochromogenes]
MEILELCAGYGGLGAAVAPLVNGRLAYVAESAPGPSAVLAERYPDAPNLGDIRDIDWVQLVGLIDVITAGFPCQDISIAGNRVGIRGARSGVWVHVAEAVRIVRPRFVFLENVSNLRTRGLEVVVSDLAEIGYSARWVCVRASEAGAPHLRDRWFCIATPEDADSEPRI